MQRPKLTRIITFRVTDEEWIRIQAAAAHSGITPNEWCRTTALERLNLGCGLAQHEIILFGQISRLRFLVENALELLAEDKLYSDVWKSYRLYARENLETIQDQALAECSLRRQEQSGTVDFHKD